MEQKTNWTTIIVTSLIGYALGFVWYGMLFNTMWAADNNYEIEGDKMFKNGVEVPMSLTPMIFNLVSMIIYALLIDWLLKKTGAASWQDGAKIGAIIGVIMLLGVFTGNMFAGNPMRLSVIDGSYSFIMFVIFGAMIGGWKRNN